MFFKPLIGASFATALLAAAPASAVIETFASFSPIGGSANVYWQNSLANQRSTSATFVSTATAITSTFAPRLVSFSFLAPSLTPFVTSVSALFRLNASVAPAQAAGRLGNFLVQDGVTGSFSFLTIAPITVSGRIFAAGSNLLTGSFGGTTVSGQRNGSSAAFAGSTGAGDTLTYTSDFLSFANVVDSDFSISLSAVTGVLQAVPSNAAPTAALRNFRAVASGTFSTDPAPIVTAVPEPAVWGLMIVGFGVVGLRTRRRARHTVAA